MTDLTITRGDGPGRWGVARLDRAPDGPVRVTADGQSVAHQVDSGPDGAELILDLAGTEATSFTLTPGDADKTPGITTEMVPDYQGQAALRIATQAGDWVYHTDAGGFASLIDTQGRDWISFRPFGGSDGIYRGIPNLAFPENVFHPGHRTVVTGQPRTGPLRVTLDSASHDGKWVSRWHIYPDHAELTVRAFDHPYWLLYEGTPGGKLDEDSDFTLTSAGTRRPLSERWDEVLPAPKWIAFGKAGEDDVLWLQSHADGNAGCRDSCYAMERNMTVFGFGRVGMDMTMQTAPARFTVGFARGTDAATLSPAIEAMTARVPLALA